MRGRFGQIMDHYGILFIIIYLLVFMGGTLQPVAVACCQSCADLGIFGAWPISTLVLESFAAKHPRGSLFASWFSLGMLFDLISLDFQLRFHRILMDFEGLYAWAQDLPTDRNEMDWATDSQHHLETCPKIPKAQFQRHYAIPMPYRCCCNDEN